MKNLIQKLLHEQVEPYKYQKLLDMALKANPIKSKNYHDAQELRFRECERLLNEFNTLFPKGVADSKGCPNVNELQRKLSILKFMHENFSVLDTIFLSKGVDGIKFGLSLKEYLELGIKYHEEQKNKNFNFSSTLTGCEKTIYDFLLKILDKKEKTNMAYYVAKEYHYEDGSYTEDIDEQAEHLTEWICQLIDAPTEHDKELLKYGGKDIMQCISDVDYGRIMELSETFIEHEKLFNNYNNY